jgi:4-amino-4-deoxy-L-arabinose transferase-like glycosyltransferase
MIRVPSLLLAALDVGLLYAIAARVFERARVAALAAGLLVVTPAHFVYGRLAVASLYPVTCVLAWLLCLTVFVERRRASMVLASTIFLGIGFYSHPTAVLMMPACLGLTLAVLWWLGEPRTRLALALVGFVAPLLPLIPWFARHHATFRFTLGDWGLHTLANPVDGLRYSVLNWSKLATRSSVFWSHFSPSYLFLGREDAAVAVPHARLFLALTAVPLVWGLYRVVTRRAGSAIWRVVLAGFLIAPLAAAAFEDPYAVGRDLYALPFAMLIAGAGFDDLLTDRRAALRAIAAGVICLTLVEFLWFYRSYASMNRAYSIARGALR